MAKDVPQDVAEALGRFVVEFSRLEFMVQLVTWSLIDDDLRIGWSLTGGETAGRMFELCGRLVNLRAPDDPTRARFQALRGRLQASNVQRNRVLHAFWGWDETAESLHSFRVNRAGEPEPHVVATTAADFKRFASEIRALADEFGTFGKALLRSRLKED